MRLLAWVIPTRPAVSGVAPTVRCMALWTDFAAAAPRIAEVFTRRHAATGNLCMLGTLRPDGFPRISPMEPRFLEGDLWLVGMPHTAKFADLRADPRFALHTATVDTQVHMIKGGINYRFGAY